jgi:hypothetical protein
MKKCRSCGKSISKLSRCRQCLDKENARQKNQYEERLKLGLCPRCGGVATAGQKHCQKCSKRTATRDKQRRLNRLSVDLCARCGRKQRVLPHKLCPTCKAYHYQYMVTREARLAEEGLCTRCGKNKFLPSMKNRVSKYKDCIDCYLKRSSQKHFGSDKFTDFLLDKLKSQEWICPYTGDKLVLGDNDSVDHIHPQKRFPDQATDLNNIEWISRRVNMMKQDLLPDEFLDLIAKIYNYRVK